MTALAANKVFLWFSEVSAALLFCLLRCLKVQNIQEVQLTLFEYRACAEVLNYLNRFWKISILLKNSILFILIDLMRMSFSVHFDKYPGCNWNILLDVDWDSEVKVFLLLAKDKDNWSFSGTMKVSGKRDATQMLTGSSTHSLPQNGALLHLAWHCTVGACSLCRVKVKSWGQLLGSPGSANEAVSSAFVACPLRRGRKKPPKKTLALNENNSNTKVTVTSTGTAVWEQKNQMSPLMLALV